jgi:glutathione S-transferase
MGPLTLVIGNKNYSSWSMRAWLLLRWLRVSFDEIIVPLYRKDSRAALLRYSPTARVPVLLDVDLTIWDTLAIVEHMADTYPQVWPADRARRAFARSICAEMHSSFITMRSTMPFNARARDRKVPSSKALLADTDRIQDIWAEGRQKFGYGGPYLLGEFGIADIMFAPPATRFITYGVEVRPELRDYHRTLLAHPLVIEWFEAGQKETDIIPVCEVGA